MDKEMMKGSIDLLILALLAQEDMYGYDIAKRIKKESNHLYKMSEGTLYPALKRLEGKGYLVSYWQETKAGKKRKYYSLTENGKELYKQKVEEWQKVNALVVRVTTRGRLLV
ncbi:PadR family transcriptional regulator [Thermoflavimicrobium daqui]|uniref:PadR family transcriptional regulator n=1 Tax=Thermoflavimicrobium daqui TaxID=2137476 RepID=A0A364K6G4_9BACL|nr:PadR family transcriptional regulator [Thermoflavimicrobium daqui]RAL25896.1 PadR family transcriptional regulator [Thermoflavimicrobium daqui]